jgi:membrane protein DedA with SNARE-associated domain
MSSWSYLPDVVFALAHVGAVLSVGYGIGFLVGRRSGRRETRKYWC